MKIDNKFHLTKNGVHKRNPHKHQVGEFETYQDAHSFGRRPYGVGKKVYLRVLKESNGKLVSARGKNVGTLYTVYGNIAEVKTATGYDNYSVDGLMF